MVAWHPRTIQVTLAEDVLVVKMSLESIPPAEHLPASADHDLPREAHGVGLGNDVHRCVVDRDATADPLLGLEEASVGLQVTFEIGHATVPLDVVAVVVRASPAIRGAQGIGVDGGGSLLVARLGTSENAVLS